MSCIRRTDFVNLSCIGIVCFGEGTLERLSSDLKIWAEERGKRLGPGGRLDPYNFFIRSLQSALHVLVLGKLFQTAITTISDGRLYSVSAQLERLAECEGRVYVGGICRRYADHRTHYVII